MLARLLRKASSKMNYKIKGVARHKGLELVGTPNAHLTIKFITVAKHCGH